MKINRWMEKVENSVSGKSRELSQVILANKLHRELENKTLEQVLVDHLCAADTDQVKTDAQDMHHAIEKMYADLDAEMTDEQVQAHLNKALDGQSLDNRGKYLVNLLICFDTVNPEPLTQETRWQELKQSETFRQEDVTELLEMTSRHIDGSAGFMARQEFQVMEYVLQKYSPELVEQQMNSGSDYAEAYAAALYIISHQSNSQNTMTPYEMGLRAAHSVESSRLLAMYHCSKLRMEEVLPKLKVLAKKLLVQTAALVLRLGISGLVGWLAVTLMGLTDTALILIAGITYGLMMMSVFTQEEAVQMVLTVWNGAKALISKLVNLFKGDTPTDVNTLEVTAQHQQTEETYHLVCDTY